MHKTRLFEIERVPIELGKIRCDVSTLEISKQLVNNANALKNIWAKIKKKAHLLYDERCAKILASLKTKAPGGSVESGEFDVDQLGHITIFSLSG